MVPPKICCKRCWNGSFPGGNAFGTTPSRAGEVPLTDARPPEVRGPEDDVTNHDLVVRALAGLAPRMRAVLVLRFFDDLTEADTAAALRCGVGTVKSQTSRGLARLREQLTDSTNTRGLTHGHR
jgi:DNA-directed RNA polymerase specialized sigma24 family protein